MNPYSTMGQQNLNEKIDNEIAKLQQMKTNVNQPTPAINQTFQLAPNNHTMKYANTIDDVNKEIVYLDTPFFSKDMSVLWIKNAKGDIKTYELNEIVPKDEKDMQIEYLQSQIEELKGMIKNEQSNKNVDEPKVAENTTTTDEPIREPIKKNKSSSIQKISSSKEE
jgi:hypothetical protein